MLQNSREVSPYARNYGRLLYMNCDDATIVSSAPDASFGGTAATFSVSSPTQIVATSPARSAGVVHVTVTTPSGTSATGAQDQFTYVAPPGVSGLTPTSGPTTGGTSVTVSGTDFSGATAVSFGGTAAAFTVDTGTQITATSPVRAAGAVHAALLSALLAACPTPYIRGLPVTVSNRAPPCHHDG